MIFQALLKDPLLALSKSDLCVSIVLLPKGVMWALVRQQHRVHSQVLSESLYVGDYLFSNVFHVAHYFCAANIWTANVLSAV